MKTILLIFLFPILSNAQTVDTVRFSVYGDGSTVLWQNYSPSYNQFFGCTIKSFISSTAIAESPVLQSYVYLNDSINVWIYNARDITTVPQPLHIVQRGNYHVDLECYLSY